MNRMYALMLALGAGLFVVGCDDAADLVREQQSKAIQGMKDKARTAADEAREAATDSVLKGDKAEDAEANALKGSDEK